MIFGLFHDWCDTIKLTAIRVSFHNFDRGPTRRSPIHYPSFTYHVVHCTYYFWKKKISKHRLFQLFLIAHFNCTREARNEPSIGHIGSTLWIITISMYDNCNLTKDACTDSIMCFRDNPRPSVLRWSNFITSYIWFTYLRRTVCQFLYF